MTNTLLLGLLASLLSRQDQAGLPTYPTFQPFVGSRMFALFGDPKEADLQDLSKKLSAAVIGAKAGKEAAEQFSPPMTSRLSALLEPVISDEQRAVAPLVPLVLMKLEPLWTISKWTSGQVAEARAAMAILGRIPAAPAVAFTGGKDAENHAALESLVRWYRSMVSKPEWYAAMIFTMDDGPYAGLPYEASATLPAREAQPLDEKTELRLCHVEREHEPWALQVVREGKPLWTRVLSAAPDESVSDVSFLENPVQAVGPYGWKVRLLVEWSGGQELSEVFLDPKANLLFYFLSW